MAGREAYPVVSRECGDDRHPKPHIQITCARCGTHGHLVISGSAAPPALANQTFRRRGWIVGRSRTRDRCPKCNPRLGTAKAHAAVARIAVDLPLKPVNPPEIPQPIPNIKGVEALPHLVVIQPPPEVRQPTREDRRRIVEEISASYTDIGYVGTASDATIAMELGCDAVLMNTAIAGAANPILMASAMRKAVEAGREAYLAGRMPKKAYQASPSSPTSGIIGS